MELRRDGDELLFMGFNQDASCVSIGTNRGYRIYNCQPFGRNIFSAEGGISIVEMLFCTSLVALVGARDNAAFSPRHLKLWNTKTASVICELDFEGEIQAVKMNRKRLIVVLQSSLHIYDLDSMVNLQTLEISTLGSSLPGSQQAATAPGTSWPSAPGVASTRQAGSQDASSNGSSLLPSPLCELSPDENNSFLALPANSVCGDIFLYDALNLVEFRWIKAHKSPLTALKFSLDGTLLATASETGTVIRVFRVPTGERLFSFRRGTYSATLYSLAFDETNTMLAASTSNGTVHVFSLGSGESLAAASTSSPMVRARGFSESGRPSPSVGSRNGADADMPARSRAMTGGNSCELEDNSRHGSGRPPSIEASRQQPPPVSQQHQQHQHHHQQQQHHQPTPHNQQQQHQGGGGWFSPSHALSLLEGRRMLTSIMPGAISDLVEPCRSFAIARLKNNHVISRCSLAKGLLCVVTSDGYFSQFNVQKGACELVFEMQLHGRDADSEEDCSLTRFYKTGTA
mmetsp:Transcript_2440/g.7449  ORF Transcript_2440/g.7449 Transcript_2440/m.7449 type:complete len:515 (+) Transcript_2440:244-1788(+)